MIFFSKRGARERGKILRTILQQLQSRGVRINQEGASAPHPLNETLNWSHILSLLIPVPIYCDSICFIESN